MTMPPTNQQPTPTTTMTNTNTQYHISISISASRFVKILSLQTNWQGCVYKNKTTYLQPEHDHKCERTKSYIRSSENKRQARKKDHDKHNRRCSGIAHLWFLERENKQEQECNSKSKCKSKVRARHATTH
jgi:hypothetical protein